MGVPVVEVVELGQLSKYFLKYFSFNMKNKNLYIFEQINTVNTTVNETTQLLHKTESFPTCVPIL